jgi:hypothetical protein
MLEFILKKIATARRGRGLGWLSGSSAHVAKLDTKCRVLGMPRGNRRESLTKPHLAHVNLRHFCPRWFCRDEQHCLEVDPPLVVRLSAPLKPVLP